MYLYSFSKTSLWQIKKDDKFFVSFHTEKCLYSHPLNWTLPMTFWEQLNALEMILHNVWDWASRLLQLTLSYFEHSLLEAIYQVSCLSILRLVQWVEDQNSHIEKEKHVEINWHIRQVPVFQPNPITSSVQLRQDANQSHLDQNYTAKTLSKCLTWNTDTDNTYVDYSVPDTFFHLTKTHSFPWN